MNNEEKHITPYKNLLTVLAILVTFTLVSVGLTRIHLGTLTVAAALIIAAIKSSLVLRVFMHLRLESMLLRLLTAGVATLIALVIIGTITDYIFR